MPATNGVPPGWSVVAILAHASADRPLCVSCCCCLAIPWPEDGRDLPRHPSLLLGPGGVPRSRLLRLNGGLLRLQCLQIMPHQVEDNDPGDERIYLYYYFFLAKFFFSNLALIP
ncbi:hypothetical protein M9H77_11399 [Catharanthus roseus]|uniref:Uncharacterized protein n=1 Tax=Catharanthus roseus TaxID=4058 RepID=A0ACC0BEH9_CATRO|nr:hypothetical protein M9H77_11399 [Catharanthus roseus]